MIRFIDSRRKDVSCPMSTQTPDTRLIRNMKQITDGLEKYGNRYLRDTDLTFSQGSLALFVEEYPEENVPLKTLEELLNLSQPTVFGLASRLEKRGLLESSFSYEEGRVKKVKLTPAGVESMEAFKKCVYAIEDQILSNLTQEEQQTFINLLVKVNQSLKDTE